MGTHFGPKTLGYKDKEFIAVRGFVGRVIILHCLANCGVQFIWSVANLGYNEMF